MSRYDTENPYQKIEDLQEKINELKEQLAEAERQALAEIEAIRRGGEMRIDETGMYFDNFGRNITAREREKVDYIIDLFRANNKLESQLAEAQDEIEKLAEEIAKAKDRIEWLERKHEICPSWMGYDHGGCNEADDVQEMRDESIRLRDKLAEAKDKIKWLKIERDNLEHQVRERIHCLEEYHKYCQKYKAGTAGENVYDVVLQDAIKLRPLLQRCAEIIHENYERMLDTEQANRLLTDLKAYATESEGDDD